MKAGGAAKRQELIKAFGEMSISTTYTKSSAKEYTAYEKRINEKGDIG